MELGPYLEDLENRIEPAVEDELLAEWTDFTDVEFRGGICSPRRRRASRAGRDWSKVPINDAWNDFDRMALHQLRECSESLGGGSGRLMNIRCNYGTGILPSLFGAKMFMMDREMNTLPTTRSLDRGEIDRAIAAGVPDLNAGLGGRVFEMGRRFVEMTKGYEKISRYVTIYHPDLQGPMDVCELLWGSSLFLAIVDEPDAVKALLELITTTYVRFMQAWNEIVPPREGHGVHWAMMHRGRIMLRDDSAMNLSPEMFEEFIEPYDRRLLGKLGGGALHFCGRGDHYIHRMAEMTGVHAVAMSQPEYNDMEKIFAGTVDRGVLLLGLSRPAAEAAIARGRDLRGRVHCW